MNNRYYRSVDFGFSTNRNRGAGLMTKVIAFILGIVVLCAIMAAFSAMVALLVMFLWNFIMGEMHHPEMQVGFFVAWAAMFLLGLIATPFRSTTSSSNN